MVQTPKWFYKPHLVLETTYGGATEKQVNIGSAQIFSMNKHTAEKHSAVDR